MAQLSEADVYGALSQVKDPDLHKDIVRLGFIKDLRIEGGEVSFRVVLTTPACPVREQLQEQARAAVAALPGVETVSVTMDAEVPKGRGLGEKVTVPGVLAKPGMRGEPGTSKLTLAVEPPGSCTRATRSPAAEPCVIFNCSKSALRKPSCRVARSRPTRTGGASCSLPSPVGGSAPPRRCSSS